VSEHRGSGESDSGSASDTESESESESGESEGGSGSGAQGSGRGASNELSDASARTQQQKNNAGASANTNATGQNRLAAASVTNLISGAKEAMAAAAASLSAAQQQTSGASRGLGNESAFEGGDDALGSISAFSANAASSIMPLTATDSVVSVESAKYTPRGTANGSAVTTKVQGTENGATPISGRSAVSLAGNANGNGNASGNGAAGERVSPSRKLLARLPKTPDGTDAAASKASSVHSKQAVRSNGVGTEDTASLHKPTACPCGSDGRTAHYTHEALDAVFPLSLPLLFRVVFSASVPADLECRYMPADKVGREELAKSCTKRITECGNSDVKTEGW
ncbi:hypothetical protein LPJ75_007167, partial [Coemansia sp. RSA 2598]